MTMRPGAAGFTMVELVVVMILIGVLAAIGIPRLMGDKNMEAAVFGDQVVSGLRRAQKIATGHRRVVCASVGPKAVIVRLNACGGAGLAVTGLGDGDYATTDSVLTVKTTTLFFQPDGRITTDAAGTTAVANGAIDITGNVNGQNTTFRTIRVEGTTGYVE
ncbi:pilus assembly FimT family protein [Massilia putida]|uniref:pilus assembly FimT family protein n=1 Tax=Massilia putida TaxID=1141883 RepID=UPI0009F969A8|nr:prepilin-type N-terminal cleavage/methylation domain-containing protein [Massilia putida]